MDLPMLAPMPPAAPPSLQQTARNRIRLWLSTTETTQQEFCERIGQNQSWLSRFLHGKLDADVDMLQKMATAFGHSICALLSSPTDPEEARLIDRYRALPERSREVAMQLLEEWSKPHRVVRTRK